MPDTKLLRAYARLIVKIGVNLQKEQILVVNTPLACAPFAHLLAEEAYHVGAHEVVMSWNDEVSDHIKYALAPRSVFRNFPSGSDGSTQTMQNKALRLFPSSRGILRFSVTSSHSG